MFDVGCSMFCMAKSSLFSGVRPSSGAAGLGAREIWQGSGVFGVETLLLPGTAVSV